MPNPRPDWTTMQPWEFDASLTPELFPLPVQSVPLSDGADLLALIP